MAAVFVDRRCEYWFVVDRELGDRETKRLASASAMEHRIAGANKAGNALDVGGALKVDDVWQSILQRLGVEKEKEQLWALPRDDEHSAASKIDIEGVNASVTPDDRRIFGDA